MSDVLDYAKLIKELTELLDEPNFKKQPRGLSKLKQIALFNAEHCVAIISKNKHAKKILELFVQPYHDVNRIKEEAIKLSKLKFTTDKEIKSKYGLDYLKRALKIMELSTEKHSVQIQMSKNYPIKLSNELFDIIIAPIVKNE